MKVPEIKLTRAQSEKKTRKADASDGTRFTDHLAPASGPSLKADISGDAGAVVAVTSILSVQEVEGEANEDQQLRRLIQWGEDILDQLDKIRHDLLMGAIPLDRLSGLAQAMRDRKTNISDPGLLALINEIELRAEVEIAKYSRDI